VVLEVCITSDACDDAELAAWRAYLGNLSDDDLEIVLAAHVLYTQLEDAGEDVSDAPVVRRDKHGITRSHTKSAREPSEAQRIQRERFAQVAAAARGLKQHPEDELPPTAQAIQDAMSGVPAGAGYAIPQPPQWVEEVKEWMDSRKPRRGMMETKPIKA